VAGRFGGSSKLLRHPAQYVVLAFSAACTTGTLLLLLPFATQSGESTRPITALFTATSAVCVTGLAVVDTGTYWSGFGQWVIVGLIQVGGLGIMTLTSLIIVVLSRRMGLRQRMVAAAERGSLDLGDLRALLLGVIRLTVMVEATATVVLFLRFWLRHGEEPGRALYLGLFHAVSSFNNAGFGLASDNLVGLRDDPVLILVIAASIVIGGLGFPVWIQIARQPRSPRRWDLHAKMTVSTTLVLLTVGWAAIGWFEWTNPGTLGGLSGGDSVVNALFHSVTPRTAGFNTLDIAAMREPTRLLTEVLMFIGGGSGSTAGGIKVTTFALLGFVMWAEVRGDPDVVVFRRRVPEGAQRQALTVALMAVGGVILSTMLLVSVSDLSRSDLLFEAVSALGTVGLSANITPLLPDAAQLVVTGLMFFGRVGPPTLFAALVLRERDRLYRHPEERPIIG
jgi:trk system potassium uptake protein TrkH